jgi:hypothetical protein
MFVVFGAFLYQLHLPDCVEFLFRRPAAHRGDNSLCKLPAPLSLSLSLSLFLSFSLSISLSLFLSFSLSISLSLFLSSQISVLRENSSDKDIVWYNSNKVLFSLHFKSYHKDSLTVCLVLFTNGISLRLILSTTLESRRLINESLKSKCSLFVITLFIFCYNNAWHCILISNVKQEFDFLKMSKEIKILNM